LEVEADPGFRPTLRWAAFPFERKVEDLSYELRIWMAEQDLPRDLVYHREGLAELFHRMETPLDPAGRYVWSVRARFRLDGAWRTLPWSSQTWFSGRKALSPGRGFASLDPSPPKPPEPPP